MITKVPKEKGPVTSNKNVVASGPKTDQIVSARDRASVIFLRWIHAAVV